MTTHTIDGTPEQIAALDRGAELVWLGKIEPHLGASDVVVRKYLNSLKVGERVVDIGSGQQGFTGDVVLSLSSDLAVKWDVRPSEIRRMTTSPTWGTRRLPYRPGHVLAVRESWRLDAADERLALEVFAGGQNRDWVYYAEPVHVASNFTDWRPASTMPTWAIRQRFEILEVFAKRPEDATSKDAVASRLWRADQLDGSGINPSDWCWVVRVRRDGA